mmetsp:Transcript_15773/g.51632  ORF Transcript_15773/g.51632 Transcript_15773/m.51632 type:complete len:239 (+) Transcript_15773:83-799(+)
MFLSPAKIKEIKSCPAGDGEHRDQAPAQATGQTPEQQAATDCTRLALTHTLLHWAICGFFTSWLSPSSRGPSDALHERQVRAHRVAQRAVVGEARRVDAHLAQLRAERLDVEKKLDAHLVRVGGGGRRVRLPRVPTPRLLVLAHTVEHRRRQLQKVAADHAPHLGRPLAPRRLAEPLACLVVKQVAQRPRHLGHEERRRRRQRAAGQAVEGRDGAGRRELRRASAAELRKHGRAERVC